jgi:hypothetical protein
MTGKELCEKWGAYFREGMGLPAAETHFYEDYSAEKRRAWDRLAEWLDDMIANDPQLHERIVLQRLPSHPDCISCGTLPQEGDMIALKATGERFPLRELLDFGRRLRLAGPNGAIIEKFHDECAWGDEAKKYPLIVRDPESRRVVVACGAEAALLAFGPDLTTHHKSCALRSGGTECTCG